MGIEGKDVAAQISANAGIDECVPKPCRDFRRHVALIGTGEPVDGKYRMMADYEFVRGVGMTGQNATQPAGLDIAFAAQSGPACERRRSAGHLV